MKIIKKSAIFSPCNQYRYSLSRVWNLSQKPALIIGLNPSTADEKKMIQRLEDLCIMLIDGVLEDS